MGIHGAKPEEEREAAANAKAVLCALTPASVRTDRIVFALRNAANVATTAAHLRLESRQPLNELRSQVANLLNAVCHMLDRRRLDQNSIDEGKAAVQAWLDALSEERKFYKVEKWTKDGSKVDRLIYAGNNLANARTIFAETVKHRRRIRLTIRQRTRVLDRWPEE